MFPVACFSSVGLRKDRRLLQKYMGLYLSVLDVVGFVGAFALLPQLTTSKVDQARLAESSFAPHERYKIAGTAPLYT